MTTAKTFADRDTTFIGGAWVPATGEQVFGVIDPSTEEPVATVRESSPADVARAVLAARAAFDTGPWGASTPDQRADAIDELIRAIEARGEDIAQALTAEIGVPISATRNSVKFGCTYLRYYSDLARRYEFREDRPRQDGNITRILKEPIGTVAAIVPYNGPFSIACMKLAPILAAGCTAVLKSPPEAPIAVNILAEIVEGLTRDGVLPEGVLNIVVADRAGSEALVADPLIDKVTFTGSTEVGRAILGAVSSRIGRATLELGGKSAAIVLDDADLDDTVRHLVAGGLGNCGQGCYNTTRVLVSEARRDELVEALTGAVSSMLVVGDAHDPATTTGPLAGARHRDRVERYVEVAKQEGARVVLGGARPADRDRGFFFEPTVLVDVLNTSRVAQEEIFGPVVSIITYTDVDDAVAKANDSMFGLGGAVFTADREAGFELARRIRTGTVSVNCFVGSHVTTPFGGYRQSGLGHEGGVEGLEDFLQSKSVHTVG
ncbi:aldehyde dehydrogenase [Pseudonocardia halophobica]|uniref:Aldehyde dehydrogenase n=1 Tax=Pseudonocardia halophobica TaxID=29401 RepID=A0A9W6L1P9_9PSEU|nr:aldehyde dehydrogenase family protein [Pseudonocardia halophobica]GLL10580.1 putative aldehyde dehydrogenase [Pseudonocardia halophobica]